VPPAVGRQRVSWVRIPPVVETVPTLRIVRTSEWLGYQSVVPTTIWSPAAQSDTTRSRVNWVRSLLIACRRVQLLPVRSAHACISAASSVDCCALGTTQCAPESYCPPQAGSCNGLAPL
jgi:hypothetical protein